MQNCINFQMQVKKKIPEVMEFVTKKMVEEKMASYCTDKTEKEQFEWWCGEYLTVDKAKGFVDGYSDVHMDYDYIYTFQSFVEDLAENVPGAEFTGSIEKNNDDIGTEITIEFKMKKGELEFEEVYPEGYGYDEYDEEEDYDEDEEE